MEECGKGLALFLSTQVSRERQHAHDERADVEERNPYWRHLEASLDGGRVDVDGTGRDGLLDRSSGPDDESQLEAADRTALHGRRTPRVGSRPVETRPVATLREQ